MHFTSKLNHLGAINFPRIGGTRIMMMPCRLNDVTSIPASLQRWTSTIQQLFSLSPIKEGTVYLTIDQKVVKSGESHRRGGLHVDAGGWGGGGGVWGGGKNGMLVVSDPFGCRAYHQEFDGEIGHDGDCEHLREQCKDPIFLQPGHVYWCDPMCVHESVPMQTDTYRTFIRLSLPSTEPWYEGYTKNPKGIQPTGPILPKRKYQHEEEVILPDSA